MKQEILSFESKTQILVYTRERKSQGKVLRIRDYRPWTARAETPVFSILLANSTVSCGDFKSRILQVTGVFKFLLNVVKIWYFKEKRFKHVKEAQSEIQQIIKTYIMNKLWFGQQSSTHPTTHRK